MSLFGYSGMLAVIDGRSDTRTPKPLLHTPSTTKSTSGVATVRDADVVAAEGERIERERFVLRHRSQSEMVDKGLLHKVSAPSRRGDRPLLWPARVHVVVEQLEQLVVRGREREAFAQARARGR